MGRFNLLLLKMADDGEGAISGNEEEEDEEEYEELEYSDHASSEYRREEASSYWESLKKGILSYPVSLRLQCLLYIIGHIFTGYFNSDDDNLPINSLGLLPRFIRIKLLHLLPAVDVAKLEDTPVTNGISMDEVWEVIYKERLPLYKKEEMEFLGIKSKFGTPEDLLEEGIESVTWKEAYFNTAFLMAQLGHRNNRLDNENCHCIYEHFISDMFFSSYNSKYDTGLFECLSKESLSVHGVYRCTHQCSSLTTGAYTDMFGNPSDSYLSNRFCLPLNDVIQVMSDCNVSLKHLHISDNHIGQISPYLENEYLLHRFLQILTSIEAVSMYYCSQETKESMIKILNAILGQQRTRPIKFVKVGADEFDAIFPLLIQSPSHGQRKLEISLNPHGKALSQVDVNKKHVNFPQFSGLQLQSPGSISLSFNSSVSPLIIDALQHFQEIEMFSLYMESGYFSHLEYDEVMQCIADLMLRPTFNELVIEADPYQGEISFYIVLCLFRNFFSSPYPVSMTLSLSCPPFPPITESLTVNHDQATNKSLQLIRCFSNSLSSLLPRNLVLKSIKLGIDDSSDDSSILSSFASLESITVDSFSLTIFTFATREIMIELSTLFRIVNTKEWDLSIYVNRRYADMSISILSQVAHLLCRFDLRNESLPSDVVVSIIETIFHSISSTNMSSFELGFSGSLLDKDLNKAIYECWERCGGVKLKKISLFKRYSKYEVASEILSDITNEVWVGLRI